MKKSFILFCFSLFVGMTPAAAAEGLWLADIPQIERKKTTALFSAIGVRLKKSGEDHERTLRDEAQYAKKGRFLARSLDLIAASSGIESEAAVPLLADLAAQRRLRWQSAVDLAERRYGRVNSAGFESVAASEERLREDGAVLAQRIGKHLAKMRPASFSALVADLEARLASHPDCPKSAFAELRTAAAALPVSEKRRWALSLVSGLPRAPVDAFSDDSSKELSESAAAASPATATPKDAFVEALIAYRDTMEAAAALRAIVPAAAAFSWHVDAAYAELPPAAAASVAAGASTLAETPWQFSSAAAREFPWIGAALSEYSSLLWIVGQLDPSDLLADFALDASATEAALLSAWRAVSSPVFSSPEVDLDAVRSAERMTLFLESEPSPADILASFAVLRGSNAALKAFAVGERYAAARQRVLDALVPALAAAETTINDPDSPPVRVSADNSSLFGFFSLSADFSDGQFLPPELFAPVYALSLSASLGFRGTDPAAAAVWLESKGVFLTIPCVAHHAPPRPEELDALSDGTCFYPAALAVDQVSTAARNEYLRRRLAVESALIGVPFRLVDSSSHAAERLAVFLSGPARYRDLAKRRSAR